MTDRATALRVLAALGRTPIGGAAVLVGSSGLFGFETQVPALTEDVDISIPEPLAAAHGDAIVAALAAQGFEHEHGTATFVSADGVTFDLLGHGEPEEGDHIGGAGSLRVMVFEDISRIVGELDATIALPEGGRALSPAGFVASKLLTERAHKGTKDKLQALLVIAEHAGDPPFEAELTRLLGRMDDVRLDDVRAGAQDAAIALGRDPTFSDAGAEGYASALRQAELGLARLLHLLEDLHA
ncbi:hypothetical protein [Polyangium spumosum]|uniref:Nucleotidyl transferase AbiEii/AbiGii toxin family protein n=1 Tax=Polyangium spumosum TaxID=889282 RepID=A0A6N7PY52_9BACT|nr:hypothetical protein [Polyangium spumosum]MRG96829.1 hypothetical protein [Polyangium spumosum]